MNHSENKTKSYAIIGLGHMGKALAKAFVRRHIQVSVATTREPEMFAAEAAAIGPEITAVRLSEAVKADVIFLAVRFEAYREVARVFPDWTGKTIIDLTNAYGVPPEKLGGQPSARVVQDAFTGCKLVKGFNHLEAAIVGRNPEQEGNRRVIFLTSDDESAAAAVGLLAEQLGFAPVQLGRLSEGGMLIHGYGNTWGQLIFQDLFKLG